MLLITGTQLGQTGREDEAFAVLDRLAAWLDEASEPRLRIMLAFGLVFRGALLSEALNRQNEAIAVYDNLIARFENDTDPAMRELISKAGGEREEVAEAA